MLVMMFTGQRVFGAIGFVAAASALLVWGDGSLEMPYTATWKLFKWYPMLTLPLFIYMGLVLQRSRIAEDLLNTMGQLFGSIPGGLGISVVLVGGLLAATTGIVGATVIAMGLISLPSMLKAKYKKTLATGIITASGTLGQIIPPSVVLIIVADQLSNASDIADNIRKTLYQGFTGESSMPGFLSVGSTSAGEMFLGAIIPGILLVILWARNSSTASGTFTETDSRLEIRMLYLSS